MDVDVAEDCPTCLEQVKYVQVYYLLIYLNEKIEQLVKKDWH